MVNIKKIRPIKIGNSYYFRIPKQFVTNGIIDATALHDVEVKERE